MVVQNQRAQVSCAVAHINRGTLSRAKSLAHKRTGPSSYPFTYWNRAASGRVLPSSAVRLAEDRLFLKTRRMLCFPRPLRASALRLASVHWTAAFRRVAPEAPRGALAQLGERLICIQEVTGSIPVGSTTGLGR